VTPGLALRTGPALRWSFIPSSVIAAVYLPQKRILCARSTLSAAWGASTGAGLPPAAKAIDLAFRGP